ncbi:MAG: tetratricopeptide repeat protein [Allosphingosinicella sp.]|uniref:tetratricopeptide repeat protein n=1 Tax=Allosphingosinicella sp. TaxID=2823234 RepID=UPI003944F7CE
MGWAIIIAMGLVTGLVLWRVGRFDRAGLQLLAASLLFALAGYVWQGRPTMEGRPKPAAASAAAADSEFAELRPELLGRFDAAGSWLTIAESYQRRGDTRGAVGLIRNALRRYPENAILWIGLGNALVLHADGLMSPAAHLAFQRAARLAPDHPAPPFFYGLSLAQAGEVEEAEAIWRDLLARAPEDSEWHRVLAERLQVIDRARAAGRRP